MVNKEKVIATTIRIKGIKKYKKDIKSIEKRAKMANKAVEQLNKSMKKFIELKKDYFIERGGKNGSNQNSNR